MQGPMVGPRLCRQQAYTCRRSYPTTRVRFVEDTAFSVAFLQHARVGPCFLGRRDSLECSGKAGTETSLLWLCESIQLGRLDMGHGYCERSERSVATGA